MVIGLGGERHVKSATVCVGRRGRQVLSLAVLSLVLKLCFERSPSLVAGKGGSCSQTCWHLSLMPAPASRVLSSWTPSSSSPQRSSGAFHQRTSMELICLCPWPAPTQSESPQARCFYERQRLRKAARKGLSRKPVPSHTINSNTGFTYRFCHKIAVWS